MMMTTLSQMLSTQPELASWSLMILGFALAGQTLRVARGLA
jgi:hypothetical protein